MPEVNKTSIDLDSLAAIQYMGEPGSSQDCMVAVMRLIQFGEIISLARIISSERQGSMRDHALLLTVGSDLVAIKSGFASGYVGQGSRSFSYVLQLLDMHGAEIEEYDVDESLLERLEYSSLTRADIEFLEGAPPVRFPTRWHEYVFEDHFIQGREGQLWREFPPVIPFGIVDSRIADLALSFWEGPDDRLLRGYRRLEDTIRERIGSTEHGTKLFAEAFQGGRAKLEWADLRSGEREGRVSLFIGAFKAFRNPGAHRELSANWPASLAEFMLLNLLFRLEREATEILSGSNC